MYLVPIQLCLCWDAECTVQRLHFLIATESHRVSLLGILCVARGRRQSPVSLTGTYIHTTLE